MTTMSEEDRINLMRNVKAGEMSVDQALKRFIRCVLLLFHLFFFVFFLFRLVIFVFNLSPVNNYY